MTARPIGLSNLAAADVALLDLVQRRTLRYFWDFAHPVSGLARERSNRELDVVTSGGSGFGFMAILAGIERGWIGREAALERLLHSVRFLARVRSPSRRLPALARRPHRQDVSLQPQG